MSILFGLKNFIFIEIKPISLYIILQTLNSFKAGRSGIVILKGESVGLFSQNFREFRRQFGENVVIGL